MLITFEGVEGSGKTTQCRSLCRWLREAGYRVLETREPDGTPLGLAVRRIFQDSALAPEPLTEVFLFLAARHQHAAQVIRPALERGEVVLSDRYTDATLAYQGYGRGLERETLRELNALATGGVLPDLTLVLDLDAGVGLKRLGDRALDTFERMDLAFHQRVRQGYLEIAREEKDRVVVLEADQPVERLEAEVRRVVAERLRRRGLGHGA